MNAVGRLGSYISRSVYTVSGPFHPFGGAVDIVVVEQQDGSFKSSPWYVRFGKFQGVLKAKEKVVSINVNGVEAGFHMYLDHKGEAYFLWEVDVEEGDTLLSPSSSGEDTDGQSSKRMSIKSKNCNYDACESDSVTQIGISNGKVVSRTNSRRSRILGLVFGRRSVKQGRLPEQDNDAGDIRTDSLERAEIAADLLEMKWSTNFASLRSRKDSGSGLSSKDISDGNASKDLQITNKQNHVDYIINDTMVDNLDNCVPLEKIVSINNEKDHSSHASPMRSERSVEETGTEMSCLVPEYLIGTSMVEDDGKLNLKKPSKTGNLLVDDADRSVNSVDIISEVASAEFQVHDLEKLELFSGDKCPKDPLFNGKCEGSPESIFTVDENEAKSISSFPSCETSTSSRFGSDAEQANGTTCLSSGTCERSFVATLQTIDLVCEVNSEPKNVLNEKIPSRIEEVLEKKDYCIFPDNGRSPESPGISSGIVEKDDITETYSQMVAPKPLYGSVEDKPRSIFTVSTFSNSTCQPLVEKNISKENETREFEPPLEPAGDPQISKIDPVQPNLFLTEISEEERLLFGDLDDLKGIDATDTEEPIIHTSNSSTDRSSCGDLPDDARDLRRKLKIVSSEVNIPATSRLQSAEVPRISKSLPNMWSYDSGLHVHDIDQSLGQTLESDSNPLKQTFLRKDIFGSINAEADNDHQLSMSPEVTENVRSIEELKNGANPVVGGSSRSFDASSGSWRIWSFPFKRSGSIEVSQSALNCNRSSDTENIGNRKDATEDEKDMPKMKVTKKKIRATTPSSEQLASLNLKEGRNTVAFTFSTPMLGKQQVDARIYLWKWDTRIVISDVDGTITRSDLLGQVMPLVGVDWSQTGVAHLFSAIKENGYQLLFLSARAISQAYHTRQFLFNLKQDGKVLPEGPVIISPDGLFPSFYREVVKRAPHEFKIACLEDIKALFPPDRNPFYAGFGNRDTDEFSYLKVGIPKGKIFIINPKGQIVVNRRVDTKSYTSFHTLVNDMFPPMTSSEQEDFNSWNFWKLPPLDIDI